MPTRSRGLLLAPACLLLAAAAAKQAGPSVQDETVRLNNLGIAFLAQYKPAEAEKRFREAVALDPNYVAGQVNAGIAALAQVRYDAALEAFGRALALDPDNIYARFNLSLIHKVQGRTSEALAEGNRALQLDPRDPDLHYHVGSLHLALRDFDRAISEMEAVIRLDPNFISAYYSLGRAWMARGDAARGKQFLSRHQELQAGAGSRPAVGLRYGEQGKYSFAMEDLSASAAALPLAPGTVTLTDVTQSSGIDFTHAATGRLDSLRRAADQGGPASARAAAPILGSGVAVADVDGDGLEDLFFANSSERGAAASGLYLNRGAMRFEKGAGPAPSGAVMSACFGDLDRDGDADLIAAVEDRLVVFVNDGKGHFTDATAASGLEGRPSGGVLGGVSLADVDHDGDLDLYAAGWLGHRPPTGPFPSGFAGGEGLLFLNATASPATDTAPPEGAAPESPPPTSALRFNESAAKARLQAAGRRTTGAVFSDFDNDRDIDLAAARLADGTTIHSNLRDGTFGDLGSRSGLPASAPILGLAAADYNKDGWVDLAATTWEGGLPRLFRNMLGDPAATEKGGMFALDVAALSEVPRQIATPQFGIAFVDLDNDGWLDLVAVNGADMGPALLVLRNEGNGSFSDAGALVGAPKVTARSGRGLAAADLDRDGDLDLVISNSGAGPTLLRNDGGNANHWLRVAPAGLHSNRIGVGAKLEVKAGRLWQKLEVTAGSGYLSQSSPLAHFGLGPLARVDTLRLLWPGGVLQDEVQVKPDALLAVEELDRKGSSCPILYAWNGAGFGFVSDFLGGSAIGYRTGAASFNTPDTDEYVKVRADQLFAKDGRLELRLVNQLQETIYFDRARLIAVDHPGDVEVFPDERLLPAPPFPPFRLFAVQSSRAVVAAIDDRGRDLTGELGRIDRVYAGPGETLPFKGYAPEHHLTLDLGPLRGSDPVVLLMHGWIDYADSTSNLAASQAGLSLQPPYLEAFEESAQGPEPPPFPAGESGSVGRGRWVRVLESMGFPAGLPRTMTVDLSGKLPEAGRFIRIGTSMRIHWDQIRVATALGPAPAMTALEPAEADLRFRGFPALLFPDHRAPEQYDYQASQPMVHWMSHVGAFTRYGDVRDLLAATDDRYVITRPGDEVAVRFDGRGLPPLEPGQVRDWLLYADGFGKDMDINSARPDTIGPMPYHAMPAYPPGAPAAWPAGRTELLDYHDAWNTRVVASPIQPLRSP